MIEIWKTYKSENLHPSQKFKVSNIGRVKSYNKKTPTLLKGHLNNGYHTFSARKANGKPTLVYVHRALAETFLEPLSEEHKYVIHKDFNKLNNKIENLQWATAEERDAHLLKNPKFPTNVDVKTAYPSKNTPRKRVTANKLDEMDVIRIKRILKDPKRKIKPTLLAKQYGVDYTTIYRIGKNLSWSWVTEEYNP